MIYCIYLGLKVHPISLLGGLFMYHIDTWSLLRTAQKDSQSFNRACGQVDACPRKSEYARPPTQNQGRRTSIKHPTSMFQLSGIYNNTHFRQDREWFILEHAIYQEYACSSITKLNPFLVPRTQLGEFFPKGPSTNVMRTVGFQRRNYYYGLGQVLLI